MSEKEVNTLKTLDKIIDNRLLLSKGARLLGLTPRHLRRLKRAYLAQGVPGLISKKRGKANHRHSSKLKERVLSLIQEHYTDYGPTLISEKLLEHHQILVSRETLRQWMHANYTYQVRKILLRFSKFTETLPMESAKLCFSAAIQNDDFEMQMLVLAHSTKDFSSRKFLSINSVMKLLEDKCYAAVEKMMIRMFPFEMTINDLVAIQRLSNGMIDLDAKCSYSFSLMRPVTPTYNSQHITPMFENARNASSVIPLPVATSRSQSTTATLTRP